MAVQGPSGGWEGHSGGLVAEVARRRLRRQVRCRRQRCAAAGCMGAATCGRLLPDLPCCSISHSPGQHCHPDASAAGCPLRCTLGLKLLVLRVIMVNGAEQPRPPTLRGSLAWRCFAASPFGVQHPNLPATAFRPLPCYSRCCPLVTIRSSRAAAAAASLCTASTSP